MDDYESRDLTPLQKAIDYGQGEFTLDDVRELLARGAMQLYELSDGTLTVTEIVRYPRKKRLRLVLAAGHITEENIDFFERLAKSYGLDGLEGFGRRGWERALKKQGYVHAYSVIVKDF